MLNKYLLAVKKACASEKEKKRGGGEEDADNKWLNKQWNATCPEWRFA